MGAYQDQQAARRAERLAEIERQVADGTLRVRAATREERASWPAPREPLPQRSKPAAEPEPALRAPWNDDDRSALQRAAILVLGQAAPAWLGASDIERAVRALRDPPRISRRVLRAELGAAAADPSSPITRIQGRGFALVEVPRG